jgi:eukaryotic-like serine/threonine-protein kinase
MPLSSGHRLGPYEIVAQLGAGGMGEVYRATDTILKRQVAIKVLPAAVANDVERLARFQREAEVLAAVNHPNIAIIYGFEKSGVTALVMELVEGPTLADCIAEGALPVDQALPIARQIAEALEAAHEAGIIHRDLKPANIKVRDDGTVKVLDFGLAKALEPTRADGIAGTTAPTITSPAVTGIGVLLGTAAYMSPEQARGKPVDRRTDIWAFGCVLYELLTGRRAFEGEDVSLTLSQILQREPALEALPGNVPARVRLTVDLCLRKSLKERLPDIGTARLMLEGAFDTTTGPTTAAAATAQPAWRRAAPFLLTAFAAAIVGAVGVWQLLPARASSPPQVVRFALPASASIAPRGTGVGRHVLAISPQGTHLVYLAGKMLHLRPLDRLDGDTDIRGTEDARELFFAPDGQWIGFHQDGQLKRMPVSGGAAIALGTAQNPWGVSWGSDGVIRYGQGSDGIWQVSPTGGAPAPLITVGKGELAHGPELLPDGWVLFTLRPASQDSWDQAQIVAQSLASGERIVLIERGRDARYLPTGHLVYGLNGVLLGVPFDVRARRVTGPAVPLVERVMDADVRTGAIHFTVSNDGTLVYLSGGSTERSTLVWMHRDGRREPLQTEALPYSFARVSPDGTRIAVEIAGRDGIDVHIGDLARGALTRLTSSPAHGRFPLWTPDSQRVVFYSEAGGGGLHSIAADGTGSPIRLTTSRAVQTPYSWAEGGRTLLFEQRSVDQIGSADIYRLSLVGEPPATPLIHSAAFEVEPAVSPDGHWLAYTVRDGVNEDVYVQPFPQVDGGRWRISTNGGNSPLWSPDGRHVHFISRGRAMSVPIETAPTFRPGTPTVMFDLPSFFQSSARTRIGRQWDVARDGERFLILNPGDASGGDSQTRIVVVLNWHEELKRLVPTK